MNSVVWIWLIRSFDLKIVVSLYNVFVTQMKAFWSIRGLHILYSRIVVMIFSFSALSSISKCVFLRDLICLLQQCFSNQCSSVSNQLLTLIIDCISLMLRLDTTALISLYQNDFISVLSGCLQYFPSGLSLTSIIDHLLGLVSVVSFFLL